MWKICVVFSCVMCLLVITAGFSTWSTPENRLDMNLSVQNKLHSSGVKVITPSDSSFEIEVKSYVGSQNYDKVTPMVQAVEPAAIFIRNETRNEIIGIALRWQFVRTDGTVEEVNQIESSPGVLIGMKPRDPFMVGKTSLINPNSVRFLTHFRAVGMPILNFFKSNRSKRFEYQFSQTDIQNRVFDVAKEKETLLKDVKQVLVILDSIVFNDGTFIGDNQTLFFEMTRATIQARKDFLADLRESKRSNRSDKDTLDGFISKFSNRTSSLNDSSQPLSKAEEVFQRSYQSHMAGYVTEIANKRLKASDGTILNDFLKTKESDFIELRRSEVGK